MPLTRTPYWTLVPCLPTVSPSGGWTSACGMLEGDVGSDGHDHWLSPEGVELVSDWRRVDEEPTPPPYYVRRVGS